MKLLNDAHFQEYGTNPSVVAKAPARFHLIGEHSWFFKDKTLSMAIDLPVYVACSKRDDSSMNFYFVQAKDKKKTSLTAVKFRKEDRWANAIKSVIFGFQSGGFTLGGADLTVYSEILPSAGFGITTAIKIAVAYALRQLFELECSDVQLMQVIERGNRKFLQTNNYIADNYTAMFAKKDNLLVTDHQKNSWDYIPFNFVDKKILLIDTHVPRFSVWNEESIMEPQYALLLGDLRERKANVYGGWHYISNVTDINEELSVVSEDIHKKLVAIMREHGDVLDAVDGLSKGDFFKFARSVNHSHETMRDLYASSCPEIDWILKRVSEIDPKLENIRNPVSCGRITGKGFGRCLYAILRESDIPKLKEKLVDFEKIFGFETEIYEVTPSDGVKIIVE